ncbi:MAG: 30S ribosomal protein S9, partial [Acidobacteriota bacterium]|nr:30S ribosomal protein S9 [Acidobacteriota bacterium]
MEEKQHRATGKRKTSTARVFLMPGGKGQVIINHIEFQEYFKSEAHRMIITQPLVLTDNAEAFDVYVNVRGGGFTGQAGATRLGIARALLKVDPD